MGNEQSKTSQAVPSPEPRKVPLTWHGVSKDAQNGLFFPGKGDTRTFGKVIKRETLRGYEDRSGGGRTETTGLDNFPKRLQLNPSKHLGPEDWMDLYKGR